MHNIAILGAGIGAQHAAGFAALPERFRVHTICDLDPTRGQALAAQYGAGFTTDMQAVMENPAIDVVDICLPPHLHFAAAKQALVAGKHVVCEKPLVPSLAEVDQLAELEARATGRIFPVFQYRYGIGMSQLAALSKAGLTGHAYAASLETHWDRGTDYYAIPWRGTWTSEMGGAVLGHAIHIHDLICAILGPVARVQAETATRVNPIETEDCAAIVLRMGCGALVTSSVTLGAAGNQSRLRILFEHVTVESDLAPYSPAALPWRFTARDPARQAEVDAVTAAVGTVATGYAGLFEAMADALDGTPGSEVTLTDARRSIELVSAIYHTARSDRAQTLPLAKGHPTYSGWLP